MLYTFFQASQYFPYLLFTPPLPSFVFIISLPAEPQCTSDGQDCGDQPEIPPVQFSNLQGYIWPVCGLPRPPRHIGDVWTAKYCIASGLYMSWFFLPLLEHRLNGGTPESWKRVFCFMFPCLSVKKNLWKPIFKINVTLLKGPYDLLLFDRQIALHMDVVIKNIHPASFSLYSLSSLWWS